MVIVHFILLMGHSMPIQPLVPRWPPV